MNRCFTLSQRPPCGAF